MALLFGQRLTGQLTCCHLFWTHVEYEVGSWLSLFSVKAGRTHKQLAVGTGLDPPNEGISEISNVRPNFHSHETLKMMLYHQTIKDRQKIGNVPYALPKIGTIVFSMVKVFKR